MEKDFVIYTDLVGTLWLGIVEEVSDSYVCVKDYDNMVKRSKCYKVPQELWNEDFIGYKYDELIRNRKNMNSTLEAF